MANVFIEENILQGWADTVREKTGTTDKMLPSALLQQTQEKWGTGGGSGGGDDGMGVTTLAAFTGFTSTSSTNPWKGSVYLTLPEDAVVEWASFYAKVQNNAGSSIGTVSFTPGSYTMTESSTGYPGYKKVLFKDLSFANSSKGYYYGQAYDSSVAIIKFPNAYMENNILFAGSNCKGVLPTSIKLISGVEMYDSLYFEGIDLRGSQVEYLPTIGKNHTELKKIWLSEVFKIGWNYSWLNYIKTWLEELHFTATTPPTVSSESAFDGLSTSCKIYVPAGTLSAYTSAANYPSASTYTYIEE